MKISMTLYNPEEYDIMQKRFTVQEGILELEIENNLDDIISIVNPKLVISKIKDFDEIELAYDSLKLDSEFPKYMITGEVIKIGYDTSTIKKILRDYKGMYLAILVSNDIEVFNTKWMKCEKLFGDIEKMNSIIIRETNYRYAFDREVKYSI